MSDNTVLNPGAAGDTIRDIAKAANAPAKTQVVQLDVGGAVNELLVNASSTGTQVGLPLGITIFQFSSVNTTTAQLAPDTSFAGSIESAVTQQAVSINFTADQPCTLVVNQYIDLAGSFLLTSWSYPVAANVAFNRAFTVNGNYLNVVITNIGAATTTTLNLNTAYGTLPAVTNLGNGPVAINEVGGVAVNGTLPVSLVPQPSGVLGSVSAVELAQAQDPTTPLNITLVSDPFGDFPGINIFDQLVQVNGLALNATVVNPEARDINQAMVLSDAPALVQTAYIPVGSVVYIDTQGYQSINITTGAFAGGVTGSNDRKTFSAVTGCPVVLGALVAAVTAGASFWFPCPTRFLVFTATTAGTFTYCLRNTPWNGAYTTSVPTGTASNNVAQFAGTTVVNAGVAGTIAIGGNIAPAVAPTLNPVTVGGVDGGGLTRRALTDTSGRVATGAYGIDAFATIRQVGTTTPADLTTMPKLITQDLSDFEGQTTVELLGQILQQMKIHNLYLFALHPPGSVEDPIVLTGEDGFLKPFN